MNQCNTRSTKRSEKIIMLIARNIYKMNVYCMLYDMYSLYYCIYIFGSSKSDCLPRGMTIEILIW